MLVRSKLDEGFYAGREVHPRQDHLVKGRQHESPITRSITMKSCKYSTVPERRSSPHGGRNGGFLHQGGCVANPSNELVQLVNVSVRFFLPRQNTVI